MTEYQERYHDYIRRMDRMVNNKWDIRFLKIAKEISTWSKDPSSKIGAVIVNNEKRILATGYNGFPVGIKDTDERLENREEKYKFVVHAEMNAIYNATYNGVSLNNSTLYVYGLPICSECAKGIIQVGVKRVVMPNMQYSHKWLMSFSNSVKMFREAGVEHEFINSGSESW